MMMPHVGIDLGTTFSCMSYIDDTGVPVVIKNSDGEITTPSVIYFDGKEAYVGKKANDRKLLAGAPIFEFVKRDIGAENQSRYFIHGYNFGACGISAIVLKKLKIEAFNFFKRKGLISPTEHVDTLKIPAIITVPAYFGEKQRNETRIAGLVAGFDVAGIINEPTAAALTYGLKLSDARKIIVFDLGGGTFDVTILEIDGGEAKVIASDGADQLGGKNWDEMIQEHLLSEFYRITDTLVPNDLKWEVQRKATKAKFDLTDEALTEVSINAAGESVDLVLHREAPEGNDEIVIGDEDENAFYFKQRSENLLGICKTILHNTLERAGMEWADIDEILLAGGSSNMPMIPEMLEKISRKKIQRRIQGFSYDTAIAQGAALFGRNKSRVIDVCSKAIGIELKENSRAIIEHLIKKNSPLPISISETFPADTNAVLKVYEGDSTDPDFCTLLGRLELGNPMGKVTVTLTIDFNGIIHASVENNGTKASLKIKSDTVDVDISELKAKIDAIDIKL